MREIRTSGSAGGSARRCGAGRPIPTLSPSSDRRPAETPDRWPHGGERQGMAKLLGIAHTCCASNWLFCLVFELDCFLLLFTT